jgi:hypothetical protein
MPVSPAALEALTGEPTTFAPGKHRLLESGDALPWLADVIPLPLLRTVVSVGDIILAAGVGILVVTSMRPRRGNHAPVGAAEVADAPPSRAARRRPGSRPPEGAG